jgi:hypothetical protein
VASYDEVVPPGKAGKLKASVHTENYRGAIVKSITVSHDDPSQPAIVLTVKANVVGSVNVLPYPALALAPRLKGFGSPAKLLIRKDPTETGTLKVSDAASSVPWLDVALREITSVEPAVEGLPEAQPGDVALSVQVTGVPPTGIHAETVTFKTGLTREPTVSIPVHVTVRAAVMLQPRDLILNPVPGEPDRASGEAFANVRDDLDPRTVAVTSDDPAFSVRVDPAGERAFHVYVDWSSKGASTPTATSIEIRVAGETVTLPVRVNLLRRSEAGAAAAKPTVP